MSATDRSYAASAASRYEDHLLLRIVSGSSGSGPRGNRTSAEPLEYTRPSVVMVGGREVDLASPAAFPSARPRAGTPVPAKTKPPGKAPVATSDEDRRAMAFFEAEFGGKVAKSASVPVVPTAIIEPSPVAVSVAVVKAEVPVSAPPRCPAPPSRPQVPKP